MSDAAILPWLASACAGLCAGVVAWLAMRSLHAVPSGARTAMPLRLPLWWRVLWPLAAVFAWHGRRLVSWRRRRKLELLLRQAGLQSFLEPHQVLGMQCATGVLGAALVLVGWLQSTEQGGLRNVLLIAAVCGATAMSLPRVWLRDQIRARRTMVVRSLPFVLDMTTLCVEGGLNLHGALQQAADKGPDGPLRDELQRVLGEIRAGMARADALRQLAQRLDEPAVRTWVSALVQAESLGMNLAPILRAQADQRRSERFLLAEKMALQAPVKMLFPLIAFIFPCTFIILAFPIAMKLMDMLA